MKKLLSIALIALASTWLQGCATGATVAGMTSLKPAAAAPANIAGSINVAPAEGGKDTNPMWTSQVDSKSFGEALLASLTAQGLASDQGRYVLKPTLKKLQQPLFGMDMTVKADVRYVLSERASGKSVMDETISSSHTATVSDAFVGVERLKLANEGAIRKNIDMLIERLGTMSLP